MSDLITQKELAAKLNCSGAALSEATKKGFNCKGYKPKMWSKHHDSGRVKGYDVPDEVLRELAGAEPAAAAVEESDNEAAAAGDKGGDTAEKGLKSPNKGNSVDEAWPRENPSNERLLGGEFARTMMFWGALFGGIAAYNHLREQAGVNDGQQGQIPRRGGTHVPTSGGEFARSSGVSATSLGPQDELSHIRAARPKQT